MITPFFDVDSMFAEMDRMTRALDRMATRRGLDGRHGLSHLAGAPRFEEHEDAWALTADLPGVTADDVELTLDDGVLHLVAERALPEIEGQAVRRERRGWRLERKVRLPDMVDIDAIDATALDGVLTVRLPKLPDTPARRITVRG